MTEVKKLNFIWGYAEILVNFIEICSKISMLKTMLMLDILKMIALKEAKV